MFLVLVHFVGSTLHHILVYILLKMFVYLPVCLSYISLKQANSNSIFFSTSKLCNCHLIELSRDLFRKQIYKDLYFYTTKCWMKSWLIFHLCTNPILRCIQTGAQYILSKEYFLSMSLLSDLLKV